MPALFVRGLIAPVIAGIMWKLMMDPSHGVLNYMLEKIGLPGSTWIFHSSSALISLALIDMWMFTPFVVLVVLAGLAAIPKEIYESSAIDGAGDLTNFIYITSKAKVLSWKSFYLNIYLQ